MRKLLVLALIVLVVGSWALAEANYQTASVTVTASYLKLTKAAQSVLICNDSSSANVLYFRLFEEDDAPGPATTSSSPILVGACKGFGQPGGKRFTSLSLISAGTSTVNIDSY